MAENIIDSIVNGYNSDLSDGRQKTIPVDELLSGDPMTPVARDIPQLRQGVDDEAWYEKTWRRLTQNNDEIRARAANSIAMAEEFNMRPSQVYENYDQMTKKTGLRDQPTNKEILNGLMTVGVTSGLLTHPVATILGVAGFMGLGEIESKIVSMIQGKQYRFGEQKGLSDLMPDASENAETFFDIVDVVGKGAILGGSIRMGKTYGPKFDTMVKEKFLRNTFTEYNMPETVYISPEKIRSLFGTGEKISPQEYDLIQNLGLDAKGYRDAIKFGIDIEVPAEKLVRITDKPWWAKVKKLLKLSPYEETHVTRGMPEGRKAVSGLIESNKSELPGAETEPPVAEAVPSNTTDSTAPKSSVAEADKVHRPVKPENGSSLDDLTNSFSEDIYSKNALEYFGEGNSYDKQSINLIKSLKNKPDADVKIYRTVDKGVKDFNSGDWVTINKKYAVEHGEGIMGGKYDIIEKTVKAKNLISSGDSLHEFGYYPETTRKVEGGIPKMSEGMKEVYNEAIKNIPPEILNDIDVKSIRWSKFPAENEGEGGRFVKVGKNEEHHIILEENNINDIETLRHELLHSYVDRHPELIESDSPFGIEKAVDRLDKRLAEATGKPIIPIVKVGQTKTLTDPLLDILEPISEYPKPPIDLGSDPSYEKIQQEASRIAYENFSKRVDLRKKKEDASLRRTAESAFKEDPVKQVSDYIQKKGGLNLESLQNDYSPSMIKMLQQKRPGLVSKKGTLFADDVADDFEFASGDEMLNMILDSPGKKEFVNKYITNFKDFYGEELETDVSDLYLKMIDEELKLLKKFTGQYKPLPSPGIEKVIREETGQVRIGNLVKEYDALKAGMKKAEQASRVAWREGRKEGAITEKERQREIAMRLRDRIYAREEMKKLKNDLIKILKNDKIPIDYRDKVQDLLSGYDLMPRGPKTERRIESLKDFLSRHEADGEAAGIPQSLIDRIDKKPWKDLTLDELRDLHDAAEMIVHLGKLKGKLIARKEARDFDDVVSRILLTIEKNYPGKGTPVYEPLLSVEKSNIEKLSDSAKKYRAELIKPEYICRMLDKYEDLGPVWQELFNPLNEAYNKESISGAELTKKLLSAFEPFTKGIRSGAKWANEKFKIEGFQEMLTKKQMIAIALNTGNEGNLAALRDGNRLSDVHIQAIMDNLSDEEKGLVNNIWSIIDSLFPELADVYLKLTGARLKKVEGNYFPLVFDRDLSWRADKNAQEAEAKDFFKTIYTKPSVEKGPTIERKGGKLPIKLDLGVIFKHINVVNHYISHALVIRDVQRLISNQDIRQIITDKFGKDIYDQFMPWLQEIARPRIDPLSQTETWMKRLRTNTTIVALGMKVTVAAQQPLSLAQSIDELGILPMLDGISKFYTSMFETVDFVKERSPMMAERWGHWDREIEAAYGKFDPAASQAMKDAFFALISALDMSSAYPTWTAAYKIGIDKFGMEGKAIEYADMIVRKTQATANPKDFAGVQRGGELKKILTMFYTFFSSMQNQMMERRGQFREGTINIVDYVKSWWWNVIFPAVVSDIIKERRLLSPKETAVSIITYRAAGLPFVRDVVSAMVTDYDYQLSPITGAGKEFGRFGKEITEIPGGRANAWDFTKHGLMSAGYLAGLPTQQAIITMEGIYDLSKDRTDDPTRLLFRKSRRKE